MPGVRAAPAAFLSGPRIVTGGAARILVLALLASSCACRDDDGEGARPAPRVEVAGEVRDHALEPSIVFEELGVTIPLDDPRDHYRNDRLVDDLERHQTGVVAEFGLGDRGMDYTNAAIHGRTLTWTDVDGAWAICFALAADDDRLAQARIAHEQVHALTYLAPERLGELFRAIEERGFEVDWGAHDEELRATLVEIVTILGYGVSLDDLSGSELLVRGVEVLRAARGDAR